MTAAQRIIPGAGMIDREYFIGVGRRGVLRAFRHDRQYSESPIAYFDGSHRPLAPRRTKSRPRTQVTHAVATRPSGFSRPALSRNQHIHGHIHRAIAELDPIQFLWIQYRYRPAGLARTTHGENFLRRYFMGYQASHLQGCKTGTRRMVRYLVAVAMETGGDRENGFLPAQYDLAAGIDVDRRNWNKTYLPHWRRICLDIAQLDGEALYKIGEILSKNDPIA